MQPNECQIYCMESMSDGIAEGVPLPLSDRFKIWLTRQLGPSRTRTLKKAVARVASIRSGDSRSKRSKQVTADVQTPVYYLQAGDMVRVKTREEIEATLGHFSDLKGLVYMEPMWQFCGTQQRVHKPLQRFVDERELRVRKAKGIVLLEGLMCEGTEMFGPCDRSCFYFWREEWLEKIN